MEIKKLIAYLSAQGRDEEKIKQVLSNIELREYMIRMIKDYEETMVNNGFTRIDALNTFKTYQRMLHYDEEKAKLEKFIK